MSTSEHNLDKWCRICGNKLQKSKKKSPTYCCLDHRERIKATYGVDVAKDDAAIHPSVLQRLLCHQQKTRSSICKQSSVQAFCHFVSMDSLFSGKLQCKDIIYQCVLLSSIWFVNTLRQLHEEERKQELPRIVVVLPLVEALLRQLNTFEPPCHLHWCTMTQMLHT